MGDAFSSDGTSVVKEKAVADFDSDIADLDLTDPATVAANRRGEMTTAQAARLSITTSMMGCSWRVLVIFIPLLFGYTAFAAWRDNPQAFAEIGLSVVIPGVVITVVMGFLIFFYARKKRAAESDSVTAGDGEVTWDGFNYAATIEGRKLQAYGNMNLAPGAYRFYYLARTGWLLSAEKIEEKV
jgi:hypothetical protein